MKLALFLLVAATASGSALLTDDVYQLPAGEWRWVRFQIGRRPATADCRFETAGTGQVRAELVSRADLELFREHKSHDVLAVADPGRAGSFSHYIQESGQYAVIIENAGTHPAAVHLTIALSFGGAQPVSRYLSPQRRLTVILVSLAMFFAIVTFSARALLRAMKRD